MRVRPPLDTPGQYKTPETGSCDASRRAFQWRSVMTNPPSKTLKVALIGCGQIADAHLQEVRKIPCARVVAVCDRQPDLAKQAAMRFQVEQTFERLDEMLEKTRPDVLHVTTPPRSHLPIALEALAAGVHLYIEKPFALNIDEARRIVAAAQAANRIACVGHDQLFDPIWGQARQLYNSGRLGDIVHIESLMGYNLNGPFGKVLATDLEHWVHLLPGGLFQNNISHALYRITDYLPDAHPSVWADWYGSIGSSGRPSELRVSLCGERTSANLIFSSAIRPVCRIARLYGTRRCIEIDLDARVIRESGAPRLPGAFGKLEIPLRQLREAGRALARNLKSFIHGDLQYFAGMNNLFGSLYQAILTHGEPPIAYAEVLRVTEVMDNIFDSCRSGFAMFPIRSDRLRNPRSRVHLATESSAQTLARAET